VEIGKWNDLNFQPNWLFCLAIKKYTPDMQPIHINRLTDNILKKRKYRELEIPRETVMDLILREIKEGVDEKAALKNVRKKMHNIIAPYLGDPDYSSSIAWLDAAYDSGDPEQIKQTCLRILNMHASTRERIPHLQEFYQQLFSVSGKPGCILDLACGLNPISIPWMELPVETEYHAYDIHTPRVKFINHFLLLAGWQPLAEVRDILVDPPEIKAEVAFFFKEAHRLEQRRKGANRELWQALKVETLIISLPVNSLSGQHDLSGQMRGFVKNTIQGLPWSIQEGQIGNELLFWIKK
jgi:16S rRNA (guanine(1405)-N(7))-methyltransferase